MLERITFARRLEHAMAALLSHTEQYCHNALSRNIRFQQDFRIPELRKSHPGMDALEKEVLQVRLTREHELLGAEALVTMLFRDGRVPGYINATVLRALPELTIVELLISRRLKPDEELNHKVDRDPPFHPLVNIPPGVDIGAFDGKKWDVNWNWEQRKL